MLHFSLKRITARDLKLFRDTNSVKTGILKSRSKRFQHK